MKKILIGGFILLIALAGVCFAQSHSGWIYPTKPAVGNVEFVAYVNNDNTIATEGISNSYTIDAYGGYWSVLISNFPGSPTSGTFYIYLHDKVLLKTATIYPLSSTISWQDYEGYNDVLLNQTPTLSKPALTVSKVESGKVTLAWGNVGVVDVTTYKVYRRESTGTLAAGMYANIIPSNGSTKSLTYVDNNVTNGKTYYYTIVASGSSTKSPHSNIVNATPNTVPKVLQSIAITAQGSTSLSVGQKRKFTAMGNYDQGGTKTQEDVTSQVAWSVTNSLGTFTGNELTTTASGSGTVKATIGSTNSNLLSINVAAVTLQSIAIKSSPTAGATSVKAGDDLYFVATGTYSNSTTKDITKLVQWTQSATTGNSNEKGAIISKTGSASDGKFTAPQKITTGNVSLDIQASLDSKNSNNINLILVPNVLDDVTVSTTKTDDVKSGETGIVFKVLAEDTYNNPITLSSSDVIWTKDKGTIVKDAGKTSATYSAPAELGLLTSIKVTASVTKDGLTKTDDKTLYTYILQSAYLTPSSVADQKIGADVNFKAYAIYSDGTNLDTKEVTTSSNIVWSSNDEAVLKTVTATKGKYSALSAGSATAKARYFGQNAIVLVKVKSAALVSLKVEAFDKTKPFDKVKAGEQLKFIATGTYDDASTAPITSSVTWTTNLDTAGKQYVSAGTLTAPQQIDALTNKQVTITAKQGSIQDAIVVNIVPNDLDEVKVTTTKTGSVTPGESGLVFTAAGEDKYNNIVQLEAVKLKWSADYGTLVPVQGTMTTKYNAPAELGTINSITVTATGSAGTLTKTGEKSLYVTSLQGLVVSPAKDMTVTDESTVIFKAEADYGAGGKKDVTNSTNIKWSIDSSIGSKLADGKFKLSSLGSGRVRVEYFKQVKYVRITVVAGPLSNLIIAASPDVSQVVAGAKVTFTASGKDQYGNVLSNFTPEWSATSGLQQVDSYYGTMTLTATTAGVVTVGVKAKSITLKSTPTRQITIKAGVINKVKLTAPKTILEAGEKITFAAKAYDQYDNMLTTSLEWTASAGTINKTTGAYTAPTIVAGISSITITAKTNDGKYSDTATLTLKAGAPTSVNISTPKTTISVSKEAIFTVKASDMHGNPVSVTALKWTATNGTISAGVFKAPSKPANVTVKGEYSSTIYGVAVISVVADSLISATITPALPKLEAGASLKLTANGYDKYQNKLVSDTWTYTAPTKVGSYKTTRKLVDPVDAKNSKLAETTITVIPAAVNNLSVSPESVTLELGDSQSFKVLAYDKYKNEVSGGKFAYSCSLGNSATITASKTGKYTMTVSSGLIKKDVAITVMAKTKEIKLNSSYVIDKGKGESKTTIVPQAYDYQDNLVVVSGYTYSVTGTEYGNKIDANGNFTAGTKEGAFQLTVKLSTNTKTISKTSTININLKAPKITAKIKTSVLKNNLIIAAKPKIDISLEDGNGVKVIRIYVDGKQVNASAVDSSGIGAEQVTASFSPLANLSEGKHSIKIEAEDTLGSKSSVTYSGLTVYASLGLSGRVMNYPNPFKPTTQSTTINYTLTQDGNTKVMIYDLAGRLVYSQVYTSGLTGGLAGENEITWNGKDAFGNYVANGVYLTIVTSDGKILGQGEISVYE